MNKREKSQHLNLLLAIVVFTVVVLLVGIIGFFAFRPQDDIIQGEADADEYRVSSKVPGRLLEVKVEEGDYVHVGDTLAILEAPEVSAKLSQAEAAEQAAQAISEKAQRGTRQEQIHAAFEMLQKAKAGEEIARKSFNRIDRLYKEGVISAQKRDEAQAQLNAMTATVKAAQAQYDMARNGAQREDKMAAAAQVSRAKGAVAEVNSYIKETVLTAAMDGEVSEIFPKIGELVGTGAPIMNIIMTNDVWVTFNVREDYLDKFKLHSTITGYSPALKKDLKLKVYYLKDLGTYAVWKATKAMGQYDMKTFQVKARMVSPDKDLRPGMTVNVTIKK